VRYPDRVEALILIETAAKIRIPDDYLKQFWAVMMGRAPQPFVTDGFSQKTIKENFNAVREMWMEQDRVEFFFDGLLRKPSKKISTRSCSIHISRTALKFSLMVFCENPSKKISTRSAR